MESLISAMTGQESIWSRRSVQSIKSQWNIVSALGHWSGYEPWWLFTKLIQSSRGLILRSQRGRPSFVIQVFAKCTIASNHDVRENLFGALYVLSKETHIIQTATSANMPPLFQFQPRILTNNHTYRDPKYWQKDMTTLVQLRTISICDVQPENLLLIALLGCILPKPTQTIF